MNYRQPGQPWPYQPAPPPSRRGPGRAIAVTAGAVASVIIALAVAGALSHAGQPGRHQAAPVIPAATTTPAATPAPAPRPIVIARFAGTGIENTPKFTVAGTWKLAWSYNCRAFGSEGNFIVTTDNGFDGAQVSELGMHGRGLTYAYGDGGRHYLAVDSECAWTVTISGRR